jgi:hypothetical protein
MGVIAPSNGKMRPHKRLRRLVNPSVCLLVGPSVVLLLYNMNRCTCYFNKEVLRYEFLIPKTK